MFRSPHFTLRFIVFAGFALSAAIREFLELSLDSGTHLVSRVCFVSVRDGMFFSVFRECAARVVLWTSYIINQRMVKHVIGKCLIDMWTDVEYDSWWLNSTLRIVVDCTLYRMFFYTFYYIWCSPAFVLKWFPWIPIIQSGITSIGEVFNFHNSGRRSCGWIQHNV